MAKIVTYNVNHSRRAEGPYAAFGWDARKEDVVSLLREIDADIVMIQEIPCGEVEWFVGQFPDHLWANKNEPGRGGNFTALATGVRKPLAEKINPFGQFSAALCLYWPEMNCAIVNVHFPMEESGRQQASDSLTFVKKVNPQIGNWIVAGDFNAFPDQAGGDFMLRLNATLGTYSASEFARSRVSGKLAGKTFMPYPYDYVPESALAMDGKLDHILVKGMYVHAAIVEDRLRPKHNWTPSDHFPVVVTILKE